MPTSRLSRLVDRSVSAEDHDRIEVPLDGIARQLGRMVPAGRIDRLELAVGRESLGDHFSGARRDRPSELVGDQQHPMHGGTLSFGHAVGRARSGSRTPCSRCCEEVRSNAWPRPTSVGPVPRRWACRSARLSDLVTLPVSRRADRSRILIMRT